MSNIRIGTLYPVIVVGPRGVASSYYFPSNTGDVDHPSPALSVPLRLSDENGNDLKIQPNEKIIGAWFSPNDNIQNLQMFETIGISTSNNPPGITITALGYPGTVGHLRLLVTVLISTD